MFQALTIRAATSNVLRQATAVNRKMPTMDANRSLSALYPGGITSHGYERRSLFRCVSVHSQIGLTNAATGLSSTLWRSAQKGLSLHKQPYIEEPALLPGRYR